MKPKPAPATPAATPLNANQRALREAKIARKYASSMVEGLVKRNIIGRYFADEADARDAIADAIKNAIHEAASPVAVLDSEFKRGDEVWIRGKVMDAYDNNPIYVSPYCVSNSTGTIGIEDLADIRHAVAMNDETPQNLQPAAAQPQRESEQPEQALRDRIVEAAARYLMAKPEEDAGDWCDAFDQLHEQVSLFYGSEDHSVWRAALSPQTDSQEPR